MNRMLQDGTIAPCDSLITIDPLRINEHNFGGPHFAEFWIITDDRIKNKKTGDVFELAAYRTAMQDGRNLMPIVPGQRRKVIIEEPNQ